MQGLIPWRLKVVDGVAYMIGYEGGENIYEPDGEPDPDALSVSFVLDLPSHGDTCFASALGAGEQEMIVYNCTSPLDGEDLDWFRAQGGPTIICRTTLTLP